MKNTTTSRHRGRRLSAAVLTIAMLATTMPGMASAQQKDAADYQSNVTNLKDAYNGLTSTSKTGANGKTASDLIVKLDAEVQKVAVAESAGPGLKAAADAYLGGNIDQYAPELKTLPENQGTPTSPWWFVTTTCTIRYTVFAGGIKWQALFGGEGDYIYTSNPHTGTGANREVLISTKEDEACGDARNKAYAANPTLIDFFNAAAKDAVLDPKFKSDRDAAAKAYADNQTILDPTGSVIKGIDSDLIRLEDAIFAAKKEDLGASITAGKTAADNAGKAVDKATGIIADAGTPTDPQLKKALDDYLAAKEEASKAQKALESALTAAENATNLTDAIAAQEALDAARKNLVDPLANLTSKETALNAATEKSLADAIANGKGPADQAGKDTATADNIIKDINASGDLTEEQKKALQDYIDALKKVRDAQAEYDNALAAAKNAKTLEEYLAALKALEAARKNLEAALADLALKQAALSLVIKIDGFGTGTAPGITIITPPTDPTVKDSSGFPNVVDIRTPIKTIYLTKNKTYTLPYVLDTVNNKTITDSKLKFFVSKPKVIKLTKSGTNRKVKALKTGSAIITIKAQNGERLKVKIIVQKKTVTLKKFAVKAPKTLKKGKTYLLRIQKLTKKASNITSVTFKSSNKAIATVDKAGKVKALKKGKVKITTKVGKKTVVKTISIKN